jgi:hypothetical protein
MNNLDCWEKFIMKLNLGTKLISLFAITGFVPLAAVGALSYYNSGILPEKTPRKRFSI